MRLFVVGACWHGCDRTLRANRILLVDDASSNIWRPPCPLRHGNEIIVDVCLYTRVSRSLHNHTHQSGKHLRMRTGTLLFAQTFTTMIDRLMSMSQVMLTTATVYLVASRLTPQSNSSTVLSRFYIACFLVNAALVLISIMNTALNSVQPEDKVSAECLRKIFTHFDKDCSGYLDRSEAAVALKAIGITATEQQKVYEVFDADQDEMISMEEFLAIGELTKKTNNLSIFHNYWTMFLIRSKMWQHEWMRRHQNSTVSTRLYIYTAQATYIYIYI